MGALKILAVISCLIAVSQSFNFYAHKKVVLDVYYESLCPDCRRIIPDQLLPVTRALSQHLKVQFFPFGKAEILSNGTITCQHGPPECYGNKIHACGLEHLYRTVNKVEFASCLLTITDMATAIKNCSALVGINAKKIEACANSKRGWKLVTKYGKKTLALDPKVYFVPTIAIDGYRGNPNDNFTSFQTLIDTNLITPVCQALKQKHHLKPLPCRKHLNA